MPRKANLLNVKKHLENVQEILDGLKKYGYCPLLQEECNIVSLLNRSILKKHNEKKTRKDLYVNRR